MKKLYAIRDDKAAIFNAPAVMDNDAVAMRAFGDLVLTDKNTLIANHPSDFSIWYIGDFDAEKGTLIQAELPRKLASGADFVNKE